MIGSCWAWFRTFFVPFRFRLHSTLFFLAGKERRRLTAAARKWNRLPYILRFRQCINEYLIPSNTSSRPLMNALKYATAFPVIFLSAAQRTVVKQVAEQYGVTPEELVQSRGRWFGEHRLFRLWYACHALCPLLFNRSSFN